MIHTFFSPSSQPDPAALPVNTHKENQLVLMKKLSNNGDKESTKPEKLLILLIKKLKYGSLIGYDNGGVWAYPISARSSSSK